MAEYKATKKRGGSLTIFAVLTARTLYTYKYEVAVNNDKLHRSASVFIPGLFILECHLLSGRPGTCPGCTCPDFPQGGPPVRSADGHLDSVGCLLPCRNGGHPPVWVDTLASGLARLGRFLLPIRILVNIPFLGPSDLPNVHC